MARKLSFEQHLETLEQIVEELEGGELTLDEALERYERGVAAHGECLKILDAAEKRIETLVKTEQGDFEAEPTAGETEDEEPS
jgi:exodeoxyribonuclease VII small subunit